MVGGWLCDHDLAKTKIAICMESRPAWPVAYLAIRYAGAVVIPVDPGLEAAAIGRILEHSEASVCFTSAALVERLRAACPQRSSGCQILSVDAGGDRRWDGGVWPRHVGKPTTTVDQHPEWPQLTPATGAGEGSWQPQQTLPTDLATIMYTSGTTGTPKGVMLSHGALVSNIQAGLQRIVVNKEDHLLGILPLFHSLPLLANCLGPVLLGARVTFLDDIKPDRILAAFREHRITVFVCVPLFFYRFHARVMAEMGSLPTPRRQLARLMLRLCHHCRRYLGLGLGRLLFGAVHRPFGKSLRLFVSGGAAFDADVLSDYLDLGFCLIQGYGLTEATAVVTATSPGDPRSNGVGSPVPGTELKIADPDKAGIGEVWVRGPSLMQGYHKDSRATNDVLQDGWLRTGDLGRLLVGQQLDLTGRKNDIVVLASGKNVYPQELEQHYGRSEFVLELCILGISDRERQGAERLHAIVVPDLEIARTRKYSNVAEMVKWDLENLGSRLPAYKRLSSVELRTDPLPRTTTRKVQRHLLRREIELGRSRGDKKPAPRVALQAQTTLVEEDWSAKVGRIIARQASEATVHETDHLDLDLGLDSLDRVELIAAIEQSCGVEIGRQRLNEVHTVADLLAVVGGSIVDQPSDPLDPTTDRWGLLLERCPDEVLVYLKRQPVLELLLWAKFRCLRALLRLVAGFRSQGHEHLPEQYPFIISPNHSSFLDPLLLAMALPLRVYRRIFFVGYSHYFSGRLGGVLARLFRTVPIDASANLETALQAAAEGLRRGLVLVIFPEGARSIDGRVREFRRGAAILARHQGVPVVPAGIWGSYQMWPRGGRIRRHPTAIAFGSAVHSETGPELAGDETLLLQLRAAVIDRLQAAAALGGDSPNLTK